MLLQGWTCTQVFEGHSHYVMQVVFNPKDTNTFASASLDRTVKVRDLCFQKPADQQGFVRIPESTLNTCHQKSSDFCK